MRFFRWSTTSCANWPPHAWPTGKAELVKLRFFGGLTLEEAAKVLGVAEPTARRWWAYARAWMLSEMNAAG